MFGLFGCGQTKYRVDYGGNKASFSGAKDAYAPGTEVTLYYPFVATDTDYSFFLDGEMLHTDYENGKGFVLRFTMPEHDAELTVKSVNSMLAPLPQTETTAPAEKEAILEYDSFDGGGPEFKVTVDAPQIVSYTSVRKYHKANHEKLTGAGYTKRFTFRGLQPGTTTFTVEACSPIADNFDETYRAEVDSALNIRLTLLKTSEEEAAWIEEPEPAP